jgi:hypothetical protein
MSIGALNVVTEEWVRGCTLSLHDDSLPFKIPAYTALQSFSLAKERYNFCN